LTTDTGLYFLPIFCSPAVFPTQGPSLLRRRPARYE